MFDHSPRYVVSFHPKRTPHHFADVLIIGGGLAGMRAAIAVPPELTVLVITKDRVSESSSAYAQGGIAGVMDPEDCFEDHVADTLKAGGSLCDRQVVESVVGEAPGRIRELIEYGARFDEDEGSLALGREGGHSHDRIVHALGDSTGREVMRAVIDRVRRAENVHVWQNTVTLDLLTHEGRCRGAIVYSEGHGKTLVWAKETILSTGGAGQLYRETTNPPVATGDGHAIAWRAGAELADMEFMQFHPTVLYIAGSSRSLITEAVRGAGARLIDRDGHRFMPDYSPQAELAPRDVVSKAIVKQMKKTQHSHVYLVLNHLDPDFVHRRFPGMARICADFGLDIARDRIPVRPGAHYMIGGVTVDTAGRTTIPGLWAAGEVTSSGLHGANRLASNSLLEGLVYGARSGEGASLAASRVPDEFRAPVLANPARPEPAEPLDLADITNSLRSLMWQSVGVERHGEALDEARRTVEGWARYVLDRQFSSRPGWELQNMIVVARLMIEAALLRTESRGVHQRIDFPATDEEGWRRRLTFVRPSNLAPT